MDKQALRRVFLPDELQNHDLVLDITTLQRKGRRDESNRKERGGLDLRAEAG